MRPMASFGPIAAVIVGGAASIFAGGQPTPPDPRFFVALGAFAFVLLVLLAATLSGIRRSPGPGSRDPRRVGPRRS